MKHFKTPSGEVYAFASDGSQDHLITASMTAITDQERDAILNPEPTQEVLAQNARFKRDKLLLASDFTDLPSYPKKSAELDVYRQALRDITHQPGFPQTIEWPDTPAELKKEPSPLTRRMYQHVER